LNRIGFAVPHRMCLPLVELSEPGFSSKCLVFRPKTCLLLLSKWLLLFEWIDSV